MSADMIATLIALGVMLAFGGVATYLFLRYHEEHYTKLESSHVNLAADMLQVDRKFAQMLTEFNDAIAEEARTQAAMIRTMAAGMAAQDEANRKAFERSEEKAEALKVILNAKLEGVSEDLGEQYERIHTLAEQLNFQISAFYRDFEASKVRMVPIPQREQQALTERPQVTDEQMQKLVSWAKVREEAAARRAREELLAEKQAEAFERPKAPQPAVPAPPVSSSETQFDRIQRIMKGESA